MLLRRPIREDRVAHDLTIPSAPTFRVAANGDRAVTPAQAEVSRARDAARRARSGIVPGRPSRCAPRHDGAGIRRTPSHGHIVLAATRPPPSVPALPGLGRRRVRPAPRCRPREPPRRDSSALGLSEIVSPVRRRATVVRADQGYQIPHVPACRRAETRIGRDEDSGGRMTLEGTEAQERIGRSRQGNLAGLARICWWRKASDLPMAMAVAPRSRGGRQGEGW
jgi:hypothetical protein